MRIIHSIALDFDDVMIRPKRSSIESRKDVDLHRDFHFKYSDYKWNGIPIISANMDTVTTHAVYEKMVENHMLAAMHKSYRPCVGDRLNVITTLGMSAADEELPEINTNFLCLDVANGYMEKFVRFVERARSVYNNAVLIAGNVVTPEMTEALILAGADVVKVGIGSGFVCETRNVTGVGVPQLTAVMECADAAHGLGGHIISDGGCRVPGDVCKAFAAGADFVILGSMLAGHAENGSTFYGLSSKTANEKFAGGTKEYRAAEGREVILTPKGPIQDTLQQITGGLRSCCSYVGAFKLKDLPKCCTFIQVKR
jgi:GMP reductase